MKKIILHIGLSKTGTTSIQNYLSKYSENNYIKIGVFENLSIPLSIIFKNNGKKLHKKLLLQKNSEYKKMALPFYFLTKLKLLYILKNNINKAQDIAIISAEGLSSFNSVEINKLLKTLNKISSNIKVVAFVRNPIEHFSSVINELIKVNRLKNFNPNIFFKNYYKRKLEDWKKKFKKNLKVFNYDAVLKEHLDITSAFIAKNNLKNNHNQNILKTYKNSTLSIHALKILHNLYEYEEKLGVDPNSIYINKAITLFNKHSPSFKERKNYQKSIYQKFIDRKIINNEIEYLKKNFGIVYEITNKSKNLNYSINDFLKDRDRREKKLLKEICRIHSMEKFTYEELIVKLSSLLKN